MPQLTVFFVCPGFMIQGGDPTGSFAVDDMILVQRLVHSLDHDFFFRVSGTGKAGESIYGKHFADEIVDSLKFSARGMLGMANKGPDTNGSQFFFSYQKLPHLNMKYPIFGK